MQPGLAKEFVDWAKSGTKVKPVLPSAWCYAEDLAECRKRVAEQGFSTDEQGRITSKHPFKESWLRAAENGKQLFNECKNNIKPCVTMAAIPFGALALEGAEVTAIARAKAVSEGDRLYVVVANTADQRIIMGIFTRCPACR